MKTFVAILLVLTAYASLVGIGKIQDHHNERAQAVEIREAETLDKIKTQCRLFFPTSHANRESCIAEIRAESE